jgi:hypothetical protein
MFIGQSWEHELLDQARVDAARPLGGELADEAAEEQRVSSLPRPRLAEEQHRHVGDGHGARVIEHLEVGDGATDQRRIRLALRAGRQRALEDQQRGAEADVTRSRCFVARSSHPGVALVPRATTRPVAARVGGRAQAILRRLSDKRGTRHQG